MKPHNFNYCHVYNLRFKIVPALILVFLIGANCKNAPQHVLTVDSKEIVAESALNINAASVSEIEKLPGIGPTMAARIVEFRDRNGPFRRAEHLILVRGMSDSKFRQIRPLLRVR